MPFVPAPDNRVMTEIENATSSQARRRRLAAERQREARARAAWDQAVERAICDALAFVLWHGDLRRLAGPKAAEVVLKRAISELTASGHEEKASVAAVLARLSKDVAEGHGSPVSTLVPVPRRRYFESPENAGSALAGKLAN